MGRGREGHTYRERQKERVKADKHTHIDRWIDKQGELE